MRKVIVLLCCLLLAISAAWYAPAPAFGGRPQSMFFGQNFSSGNPLWTPTGTLIWLQQISCASGGTAVSSWPDASGNSHNLTQGAGANQPVCEKAVQNGLNMVEFTPTNYLSTGAFTLNQPVTVFLVGNMTGGNTQIMEDGLANGTRYIATISGSIDVTVSAGGSIAATVANVGSMAVIGTIFNAASSLISYNGTTTSGSAGTDTASGMVLGAFGNGGLPMAGYIGEVVIYNSAVDTNLETCLEGYLAWEWGLQSLLPGGHPYKNAAPTTGSNCT